MKTITLKEAFAILEDCPAIIIEDGVLVYPSLSDLEYSDENEFLYIGWEDEIGQEYSVKFAEGENSEVRISGSSMFLIDTEGEENHITILEPKNLE